MNLPVSKMKPFYVRQNIDSLCKIKVVTAGHIPNLAFTEIRTSLYSNLRLKTELFQIENTECSGVKISIMLHFATRHSILKTTNLYGGMLVNLVD